MSNIWGKHIIVSSELLWLIVQMHEGVKYVSHDINNTNLLFYKSLLLFTGKKYR